MTLRQALAKRLSRPDRDAEKLADAYRKGIEAAYDWIQRNDLVLVPRDTLGVYERVYHDVYSTGCCRTN